MKLPLWARALDAAAIIAAIVAISVAITGGFRIFGARVSVTDWWRPALLAVISVGAWWQASTYLCLRFFQENEDRLARQTHRESAVPHVSLPVEPLRLR